MEETIQQIQTMLTNLIRAIEASERNLYTAAEQTENRVAKLLLKAYAQQRSTFAQQLQASAVQLSHKAAVVPLNNSGFFRRGWSELRAAVDDMPVYRADASPPCPSDSRHRQRQPDRALIGQQSQSPHRWQRPHRDE